MARSLRYQALNNPAGGTLMDGKREGWGGEGFLFVDDDCGDATVALKPHCGKLNLNGWLGGYAFSPVTISRSILFNHPDSSLSVCRDEILQVNICRHFIYKADRQGSPIILYVDDPSVLSQKLLDARVARSLRPSGWLIRGPPSYDDSSECIIDSGTSIYFRCF